MQKMRRVMQLWAVVFGLFFFSFPPFPASGAPKEAPPFLVVSAYGETLTLEDLRGKTVVLFYDTRYTTEENNDLKYDIDTFRKDHLPVLSNLEVIQIIDASSASFLTRTIWKRKLREYSKKYNITLYADWTGEMRKDYNLSSRKSNIILIDPKGMIRFLFSGEAGESERKELFELVLTIGSGDTLEP